MNASMFVWLCDAALWTILDWIAPRTVPVPAYTTTTGVHREARP